jgi:hypothetical protein
VGGVQGCWAVVRELPSTGDVGRPPARVRGCYACTARRGTYADGLMKVSASFNAVTAVAGQVGQDVAAFPFGPRRPHLCSDAA